MKFEELRQGVINKIQAELSALKAVEAHPGRFNLDELKRIATRLPAVRVAFMGCPNIEMIETGETEASVRIAAFVITGDRRGLPKDTAAMHIVEALLTIIPNQNWGVKGTKTAKNVKADNLYSGLVDRQGVAIWAISWEQTTRIGSDVWGGGNLPTNVYVAYDKNHCNDESAYEALTPAYGG